MSKWIKKGDKVVVISGNEKGKVGNVVQKSADRVVIQGVNIRKKHAKRKQKSPGAEILEMEMPLALCKVALCNADGKPVKAKIRISDAGVKELYYLEEGKPVVLRQVSKRS
ncbi:MAG: ribosomal protein [Chlamydiota bacterium]|jgi:large subunit ribosomal protein L24